MNGALPLAEALAGEYGRAEACGVRGEAAPLHALEERERFGEAQTLRLPLIRGFG